MTEQWKDINSRYQVSNLGNFKGPRGLLKPVKMNNGYLAVWLGKGNQFLAHRLVANAFVPGMTKRKCIVNHIDGNKENNVYTNLEWCTYAENTEHAVRIGLQPDLRSFSGKTKGNKRVTEDQVREIKARLKNEKCGSLAKEFGLDVSSIYNIKKGRTWSSVL